MTTYLKPGSKFFHSDFRFNGRRYQFSTKATTKREADKREAARQTQLGRGEVGLVEIARVERKVSKLLDRLKIWYTQQGKASSQNLSLLNKVRHDFGSQYADRITAETLIAYQGRKQRRGYANASVNRRIEVLFRAYSLAGFEPPKLARLPEDNAREGFFTRAQIDFVIVNLPNDLRDLTLFAFLTGMRLKEMKSLRWSDVTENTIRLRGCYAKTKKPRTLPCGSGELFELLERRRRARIVKTATENLMAEFIFHRGGEQLGEFRKSWKSACKKAGCPGRIFHDLRRSAIRGMTQAGVPQSVAMAISGHRTDSVFRRYSIPDEDDLAAALKRTERYHEEMKRSAVSIAQ